MGIDIYAKWRGQTPEEEDAQITGFSTVKGEVGYLREAYHGEPYATRHMFQECWDSEDSTAKIPASVLRSRLSETHDIIRTRELTVYRNASEQDIKDVQDSFTRFVELCEKKEAETGEPCQIKASY